ncbi:MAG: tetratricopeptide repeat protein [Pseudomonadota bacterium]
MATTLPEASQLFRQGQTTRALESVNTYLSGHPKDPQGRFLKGLILADLNRAQEAIKVFNELTDDFPELPEPYNNLAVLYAAQGQYERAKTSLEKAIRTHPSYATAHENLGDIYAKMASVAYDKALQLDKGNASAQTKLALVKDIFNPPSIDKPKPAVQPGTLKTATLTPETSAVSPPAKPVPTAKPVEAAAPSPEPAKPAKPAAPAVASVEKTVENWAAAWSRKDVQAYLGHYAEGFQPKGMSRQEWQAQRQDRLTRPQWIKVELSSIVVNETGDQATARFNQRYTSDLFRSNGPKTLTLVKQPDGWKITSER